MKAKISDYFCKNCKDAANDGILWYAVSLNRNQIMYTIDNVCLFIVDYDPRLLAIFEYVKGATRNMVGESEVFLGLRQETLASLDVCR